MSEMPDGNTAALRQHEATQDRLESRHAAYGDKVVESIVDDVVSGRGVKGTHKTLNAGDFILENGGAEMWIDHDELAILLCGRSDQQTNVRDRLRKRLEGVVRDWCNDGAGAVEVSERERLWDEDARASARRAD